VKFVKSFATWQHLAASGGFSYCIRYNCCIIVIVNWTYGLEEKFSEFPVGLCEETAFQRSSELKVLEICLFISTEYTNVTDGRTDGRTPRDGIGRAYA